VYLIYKPINRFKTETKKNWIPVFKSKPKQEKIRYRYYNLKPKPKKWDIGIKFKTKTQKNWIPVQNSKPKYEKIGTVIFFLIYLIFYSIHQKIIIMSESINILTHKMYHSC